MNISKLSIIKSALIAMNAILYQVLYQFVLGTSKTDDDPINRFKMINFGIVLLLWAMAISQLRLKGHDEK